MNGASSYDLFISYDDADRAWVEGCLLDGLEQAGLRCQIEAAFTLGAPRVVEFERAVQQSERTLLVLSPAYLQGDFNQFTSVLAQNIGLDTGTDRVIPLILNSVKLPPRLAMLVSIDTSESADCSRFIERLCAALKRPPPPPIPLPPCPYPGMLPFSETDSDRFFGRERETRELLERLRLHPFLAVIGPSGSGKSSLVFAGLVPALRKSSLFGAGEWLVQPLRPGETPLAALSTGLGSDLSDPVQAVNEKLGTQSNARRLLLVIDQFEELFTTAHGDLVPFQDRLLQLSKVLNCYVVLTARSDFYSDLFESPLWGEIQAHRFEVLRLKDNGLREAIVEPVEAVGVFVEDALVERLVGDANISKEQGVLPLVQETLVLLWDRLERRFLPLRAYAELGEGERTGLEVAIARRANQTLADLPTAQHRAIARRIFLRLIQFGEGRADTRRQQPAVALRAAGDDPQVFDETLSRLTENRLLTLSGEEGKPDKKVDIAHEALIQGWPELQGWLKQRKDAEQTRRRLEDKATEWVRMGRGRGGLLDETELAEAHGWLDGAEAAELGYSEALRTLTQASGDALHAERRAQRQQSRIRAAFVGLAAFVIIAMMVFSWIFVTQRPGEWVRGQGLNDLVKVMTLVSQETPIVFAGTASQGIFKSTDRGGRWENVLDFGKTQGEVQAIAYDSPSTVYAGIKGGRLLRSTDLGSNWQELGRVLDAEEINDLYVDPSQAGILYVCDAPRPYIYQSTNGGASWAKVNVPSGERGLSTIAVAKVSETGTVLYAARRDGLIVRSSDRGETWQEDRELKPLFLILQIVVSPVNSNLVYAGTAAGVYRLEWQDGHFASQVMLPNFATLSVAADRLSPQIVFAGGANGDVQLIQDQGSTFPHHVIARDLPDVNVIQRLEAADHNPYYLYAATDTGAFAWLPSPQEKGWFGGK